MNETKDGGPAFPLVAQNWHHKGMTLRDYFAAQALPIMLANDETEWEDDVRDAYAIADRMLRERAK